MAVSAFEAFPDVFDLHPVIDTSKTASIITTENNNRDIVWILLINSGEIIQFLSAFPDENILFDSGIFSTKIFSHFNCIYV
jgi:hypothetical protein